MTLSAAGGADIALQLTGEKLFVGSEADDDRFVQDTRELHEKADGPKGGKVYSGGAHGQRLFDSTHRSNLADRILDFVTSGCSE